MYQFFLFYFNEHLVRRFTTKSRNESISSILILKHDDQLVKRIYPPHFSVVNKDHKKQGKNIISFCTSICWIPKLLAVEHFQTKKENPIIIIT